MDTCPDESNKFQNKENIMNSCDKWRLKDVRNCSGSEDMFSDDDQLRNSTFNSPKVSIKNDTLDSPSLLLRTPVLYSKVSEITPGRAVVPKAPLSLLPLITKTDSLWTSDMETPENKNKEKPESCDQTKNLIDMNATLHEELCSPTFEKTITEKMVTTSPVLGNKMRSKKRAKRRLLNSAVLDLDSIDQQSSASSNSDKVPSDVASTISNDFVDVEIEQQQPVEHVDILPICIDESKNKEEAEIIEKNKTVLEKNVNNTSTQDFFSNASFSCIDNLCSNIIHEEKKESSTMDKFKNQNENILENDNIEKRVAAIKKNQKIIRRSSDINHTVIPKEIFSQSLRELELADAQFSQEKIKIAVSIEKTCKSSSFTPLSSLQNENLVNKCNGIIKTEKTEEMDNWFDDWNADSLQNKIKQEKFCELSINPSEKATDVKFTTKEVSSNVDLLVFKNFDEKIFNTKQSNNFLEKAKNLVNINSDQLEGLPCTSKKFNENGFSTANGKNVVIDEHKLQNYAKIYNEMENEDLNENSFFVLKKNKQSKRLCSNFRNNPGAVKLKCAEKTVDLGLHKSEETKIVPAIFENSTEIEKKMSTHTTNSESKNENVFTGNNLISFDQLNLEILNTEKISDGFSTARGKDIRVNEEKENFYSKIYEEFNDSDESSFLNIKKNRTSKLSLKKLPNKPLHVFNEKARNKKETAVFAQSNSEVESNLVSNGRETKDEKSLLNFENNKILKVPPPNLKPSEKPNLNETISATTVTPTDITLDQTDKEKLVQQELNTTDHVKEKIKSNHLPVNNDANEIYCNSEDFEDIILLPDQNNKSDPPKVPDVYNFSVPSEKKKKRNSDCTEDSSSSLVIETKIKKENLYDEVNSNDTVGKNEELVDDAQKKKVISRVESLKRKLDGCDVKRPERCRSFGGFPGNEEILTAKLNKSDPDDSLVNQPLEKNLSISQCFDSHSDSWLSKIEISHLNENKSISPDSMAKTHQSRISPEYLPQKLDDFKGFSFKESVKSFQHYALVRKFFEKFTRTHTALNLKIGETISISNQTSSDQKLLVQYENNVNLKKNNENSSYSLVYSNPNVEVTKPTNNQFNLANRYDQAQKRKHPDTENDTPLTTLKKPRVGSELQGRKLFSDEEDSEESVYNFGIQVKSIDDSQAFEVPRLNSLFEEDLSEERTCALMDQEKIIKNKKRIKVKATIGALLKERLENSKNRISWSDLVDGAFPTQANIIEIKKKHPDAKIAKVTASNAVDYTFVSSNIIKNKKVVSINVGDGASLIFDHNGHAGVNEFTEAFLAMPGVDPKLIPTGWIENHYRWIIWKLASIDRNTFGTTQLPKMLVPDRVMKELKYRYDREIDRAQRPALRKILEKDDVPSRRLVLCISSVKKNTIVEDSDKEVITKLGLPRWKVEVSDGWYSIPLSVDNVMDSYISSGKLKEGTKIITYGAELLDCERGFFPLEKPASVSLKVHTNCTRRAKWDTKLGYQMISRPIPVKLKNIVASGGMVGETTAAVARLYPLLFREKTADGQSIYRNARSEEKAAVAYERSIEKKVDAMYAEAEKNFDSRKKSDSYEDTQSTQGREIIKEKVASKVREGLPPPRQVTPVLKCRLVDDKTTVILTIWGASEDATFDIKEGDTITVYNCFAMGTRNGDLNLTANRASLIKKETLFKFPCPSRTCVLITEIATGGFEPKFGEFDTVGVVVSSGPALNGLKNFEVVNLAYPRINETTGVSSSYLSIFFWNGISSFGYQGMFTAGSLVACSNLEWRRNTSWSSVAVAYCSEKSIFTCNPRQQYLMKELRDLKTLVQHPVSYAESCSEEVAALSKRPQPRSNQGTPTVSTSFLVGNSSTMSPAEFYSPSTKNLQQRLDKLSRYGSNTEMSPIVLHNSSMRVKKDFTPVTRPKT